jgi:guanylate kinase
LLQRLRDRKREGEDAIQKRFAEAQREIAAAKGGEVYDHFVTNDDLDRGDRRGGGDRARRRGGPAAG